MIKLKVDREIFYSKISKLIKFIPSKSIIPAFDNFKITVENGVMEIVGADANMQCKMTCLVESKDAFAFCVPAKLLCKTVGLLRENDIQITVKENVKIELKSGKSKYNISSDCLAKDFPKMIIDNDKEEITLAKQNLKSAFKSSQKFIDEDSANSNTVGINIAFIDKKVVFTGLDNNTMCRTSISPISITNWSSIVCPTDTAQKISSLIDDKGELFMTHSNDKIKFFTNADSEEFFELISVAANAKFPDSERIFSKKPEGNYIMNTLEVLDAMKRLKLYTSSDDIPKVSFKVNTDNEIELYSVDNGLSKNATEIISYTNKSEDKLDKSFNADNFIKILSVFDANDFVFNFSSNKSQPSFIAPVVATEQEEMYNFLLTSML